MDRGPIKLCYLHLSKLNDFWSYTTNSIPVTQDEIMNQLYTLCKFYVRTTRSILKQMQFEIFRGMQHHVAAIILRVEAETQT